MMKKQKLFAMMLCASMSLPCVPVAAAEPDSTTTQDPLSPAMQDQEITEGIGDLPGGQENLSALGLLNADLDGMFSDMRDSLAKGEAFTLSGMIADHSDMDLSTEGMFDLSDTGLSGKSIDMGVTNLEYSVLASEMMDVYKGTDLSGTSAGCVELFQQSFGDLASQVKLDEMRIPEGFTVENMITSANAAVDSAYAGATSNPSFANIKGSISIGPVFAIANQGLSMPELASTESMQSLMKSADRANYRKMKGEYHASTSDLSDKQESLNHNLRSNVEENFLNMVDMDNSIIDMNGNLSKDNLANATEMVNDMYKDTTTHKRATMTGSVLGYLSRIPGRIVGAPGAFKDWFFDTFGD